MIIAIDGPAGSGKSSTAREVARRLGFHHLDSGAFYRAITWAAQQAAIEVADWDELSRERIESFDVDAVPAGDGFSVRVAGVPVDREIREPEVTASVSAMARVPQVREWLKRRLHDVARRTSVVVDGRDIGTVVFPGSELKVFLVADAETRARRRLAERGNVAPTHDELAAEVERLLQRDRLDSERALAPLRKAEDAVELDTTGLSFDEQVERIVTLARERAADAAESSRAALDR